VKSLVPGEELPETLGEAKPKSIIGQEAALPNGTVYGRFVPNPDDELNPDVELNEAGVRWILNRANGDIAEARKIAKKEGYVIPK